MLHSSYNEIYDSTTGCFNSFPCLKYCFLLDFTDNDFYLGERFLYLFIVEVLMKYCFKEFYLRRETVHCANEKVLYIQHNN